MNKKTFQIILLIIALAVGFTMFVFRFGGWVEFKLTLVGRVSQVAVSLSSNKEFLSEILGMNAPKTYLLVLLDDRQLTSFGGMPRILTVLNIVNGVPSVASLEPISREEKLAVGDDFWDFNDFTDKIVNFYHEKSNDNKKIDAVIAFNYSSISKVLKLVGPVPVGNSTVTSALVGGFVDQALNQGADGGAFNNKLLADMFESVLERTKRSFFSNMREHVVLLKEMFAQEQIILRYFKPDIADKFLAKGLTKDYVNYSGDYIRLVENESSVPIANDAIIRSLSYSVSKSETGAIISDLSLLYRYDNKTAERSLPYHTRVRIYYPTGGKLISHSGELGCGIQAEQHKDWCDFVVRLSPGGKQTISLKFFSSAVIADMVANKDYILLIDKQPGGRPVEFTARFDFKKAILACLPFDFVSDFTEKYCTLNTVISSDTEIFVSFAKK